MRTVGILASLAAASADSAVQPFFLQSASEVASADLAQWKEHAEADIGQLPEARQSLMRASLQKEYEQRLGQGSGASGSELPAFLVLESPHRYHTVEELDAWRERQVAEINKNVPFAYQHYGFDAVEAGFAKQKAAIQQADAAPASGLASLAELPVLKLSAEEFSTQKELDAWHNEQLQQIAKFVPEGYKSFATENVESEYKSRSGKISEAVEPPQAAGLAPLFLSSASGLSSRAELEDWLQSEKQHIRSEVPAERQEFMLSAVQQEFEQRIQQLSQRGAGAQLPAFLVLESAHRYHTVQELDAWKERQESQIRREVPSEYQHVGLQSVEKEYLKRKAQIEQTEPEAGQELPVLMLTAEEFGSTAELDQWRTQQEDQIKKYVPENYRKFAQQSIDSEYAKRSADLSAAAELAEKEPSRFQPGNIIMVASSMVLPVAFLAAAVVASFRRQRTGPTEPLLAEEQA